jgi:hypothetical protein
VSPSAFHPFPARIYQQLRCSRRCAEDGTAAEFGQALGCLLPGRRLLVVYQSCLKEIAMRFQTKLWASGEQGSHLAQNASRIEEKRLDSPAESRFIGLQSWCRWNRDASMFKGVPGEKKWRKLIAVRREKQTFSRRSCALHLDAIAGKPESKEACPNKRLPR